MNYEYEEAPTEWARLAIFKIPGKPQPKGRPRFFPVSKTAVRTYTDDRTRAYEERVGLAATGAFRGHDVIPKGVPVHVRIVAVHRRPKSLHRKKDPEGRLLKATHGGGDIDNHAKIILDACNSIIYTDDAQVCSLRVEAFIGAKDEAPFSEVSVWVPASYNRGPRV